MTRAPFSKAPRAQAAVPDRANVASPPETPQAAASAEAAQTWQGSSRLWVWGERLLLLVLVAAFAVKGFIPGWRQLNTDFPNYYLVATLLRAGYPMEKVGDWVWLQRQGDHFGIGHMVGFYPL